MDFIAAHRGEYGVEPICAVLTEHGCSIAPSTFYAAQARTPSRRQLRDAELVEIITAARQRRFVPGSRRGSCGCICAAEATTWPAAP